MLLHSIYDKNPDPAFDPKALDAVEKNRLLVTARGWYDTFTQMNWRHRKNIFVHFRMIKMICTHLPVYDIAQT